MYKTVYLVDLVVWVDSVAYTCYSRKYALSTFFVFAASAKIATIIS